jgi:hypothetical protein
MTSIENGRRLLLSSFPAYHKRPTTQTATVRNPLVATPAQLVFLAYAAPAGKTEAFGRQLLAVGKPVFNFDSDDTHNLREMGARVLEAGV